MKSNKNIIVFEDSSKSKFGGGQKVSLYVIDVLVNHFNVFLIDCKKESEFIKNVSSKVKKFFFINCIGSIKEGLNSSFSIGKKELFLFPIYFFFNLIKLIFFFRKNDLTLENTIIYSSTKKSLLYSYFLKKIMGINYIFHAHSVDNNNSLYYKLLIPALKNSNKIITVSNTVKKNINLNNCRVIYNPIRISSSSVNFKFIANKNKIIVASFSTLIKLKGIEFFIKSFKYLKNKDKLEYWIFGDGIERKFLSRFENSKIKIKGFEKNVENIIKENVDIIVFPSIVEEACPMILLEAFKYGIPVISTNIGGQFELVTKKVGLLVNPKSSKEIANKIDYLLDNPNHYMQLSKNAIEYSRKFSYNNFEKEIREIFNESFTVR